MQTLIRDISLFQNAVVVAGQEALLLRLSQSQEVCDHLKEQLEAVRRHSLSLQESCTSLQTLNTQLQVMMAEFDPSKLKKMDNLFYPYNKFGHTVYFKNLPAFFNVGRCYSLMFFSAPASAIKFYPLRKNWNNI